MPASPRLTASVRLAALLLAGVSIPLAAEPIRVSGQVPGSSASPGFAGARVELLPPTGAVPVATARPDATGLFELIAPESGCFRVRLQAAGHPSLEKPLLAVVDEADVSEDGWISSPASGAAQPPPATPRLAQGKVIDAKGAPIPGAFVWSEGSPATPCVRAGAEGTFQIRLPAGGEARLRAAARGYLPSDPREPSPKGVETALRLDPAGAILGRVVDAAGQPLAKVTVAAQPVQWMDERSPRYAATRSRADGRFRLPALSPGKLYAVTAAQEGFAPASVKTGALPRDRPPAPVRIVLERGATAFGRVLDRENRPVRGAGLVLMPADEGILGRKNFIGDGETVAQATSNPEGGFELQHLNPGRFQLRVKRQGFAPFALPEIEIPPRTARVDLGALTLDRGLAIQGWVTDPRGVPLPEALVELRPSFEPFTMGSMNLDAYQDARTGPDGHFRFDDLRRGAHFELRTEHQGYVPASAQVDVPAPEPLEIEMKPGRTLSGRVTGPAGEPVLGARLALREEIVFRLPGGESKTSSSRDLGSTDGEGKFRLDGLSPGTVDLAVSAAGYRLKRLPAAPVPEEGDGEGLEISLEKGSVLEIRALDGRGAPVAGATIEAHRIDPLAPETQGFFNQGRTDVEGRCRLDDMEPGRYGVSARSEEHGYAEATLEVKSGVNARDLVFSGGVEVSGRVSDENGAPVPSAILSLQPLEPGAAFTASGSADGTFRFPAVGDGTFRLSGSAPGFAETFAPGEIRVAGQEVRGLDLRFARGATLTGRVLGLDPEELGGILIFAFHAEGSLSPPPTGRVDREGRYRIEDLGPGDWTVAAQLVGGRSVQESLQLAPGAREAVLDLRFPTGFTLSGRVLIDQAPLAGAQVTVSADGRSSRASTGPDGGFRISNLPADHYGLMVVDPGRGLSAMKSVEITGDQEITVRLATGGLRGRISAADTGVPVGGAFIRLGGAVPSLAGGAPGATSDGSGTFEISRIAAGTYEIIVQKEGFAPYTSKVEVRPGAATPVEIQLKPAP